MMASVFTPMESMDAGGKIRTVFGSPYGQRLPAHARTDHRKNFARHPHPATSPLEPGPHGP
jgi:hypothetical protein